MNKKTRLVGIAALSAAFATTLALTITLPITVYGNNRNMKSKFFQGLSVETQYYVGKSITLNTTGITHPQDYDYLWYVKKVDDTQPKFLQQTSTPNLTINEVPIDYNEAMIYCVLTLKPQVSPTALLMSNQGKVTNDSANLGNSINDDDIVSWTQTKLEVGAQFSVSNCKVSVAEEDGVFVDAKDSMIVAPLNKAVTLKATVDFNVVYAPYLEYVWYNGNEPITGANSDTYTIPASSKTETGEYYCQVKLIAGPSVSNVAISNKYKLNVVNSTNFAAAATTVSVTGNTGSQTPASIPAGNEVNLVASFTLDSHPLETNSKDYTVTYSWNKNGDPVNIDSAKTANLVLRDVTTQESGQYVCTANISFTNGGTIQVESQPTQVTIVAPGEITLSTDLESSVSILNGDSTTLSVSASIGGAKASNLTYTWQYKRKGSDSFSNVENNGKAYSEPTLPLTKDQAYGLNGAEFRCVVSDSDPISQVKPETSRVCTLNVVNPELSVTASITSPTSGSLHYGDNVSLTANVSLNNESSVTTSNGFKYNYGYQWYSSTNGTDWNPVEQNGNGETLTINNLTAANNNTQYHCVVYPINVVTPTSTFAPKAAAESGEQNDSPAPAEKPFQAISNSVDLTIQQFGFTTTAEATPVVSSGEQSTAATTITNNLGDKFTLSLTDPVYQNGYTKLPDGYEYQYKWETSLSNQSGAYWNPITTNANQANPEIQSTTAGPHYYRCIISIAKKSSSEVREYAAQTKSAEQWKPYTTEPVTVNTYPTLTITNSSSNVIVAHNGATSLSPTITLNKSISPALSSNKKK